MAVVVRAVVFEFEEVASDKAEANAPGITKWLGAGGQGPGARVELHVLRIRRLGLLVQKPPSPSVYIHWEPVARIVRVGGTLCRYHEGPPAIPEEQRYCVKPAVTREGFCSEHASSPLALYERCAAGDYEACMKVSVAWPRETYAVYVLDYGGDRVKVGLTRAWRLLWRAAEQPHIAIAVVRVVEGDAYSARSYERELAKHRAATEGAGVRIGDRLVTAAPYLEKLSPHRIAERMAEHLTRLGLQGDYTAYTLLPKTKPTNFIAVRRAGLQEIMGRRLLVLDYWAGLLLVEDLDTGERLTVDKRDILHRVLYTARG